MNDNTTQRFFSSISRSIHSNSGSNSVAAVVFLFYRQRETFRNESQEVSIRAAPQAK